MEEIVNSTQRLIGALSLYTRLALGLAFLSAVADRFGLWGPPGATGVSWGNVENYQTYVATLNPFVPPALLPLVGWVATVAEVVAGVALLLGFRLREAAILSGLLLLAFGFGMMLGIGFKRALDFSVFAASGGAFLLAQVTESPLSIDALLRRNATVRREAVA
jgi:thiosulfate dehydrogenase (quinone) large subunit